MYGQVEDEIKHFGILGMHWGNHKQKLVSNAVKKVSTEHKSFSKKRAVGKSIVAGLLAAVR